MDGNTDSALVHQKSILCCVQNNVMRGKIITLSTANQNKNFIYLFFTLERKRKKKVLLQDMLETKKTVLRAEIL